MKADHIIVIRFSALGDVAMTVPVIASLAAQYPKLRISVVSRPMARPLFQHLAPNVDFMAADVGSEYHGVRGLNTLYRRMVAKHPTAVADLHDVLRTKFLRHRFTLEGFKVAHIDKHRKGKRRLCAQKNKELVQQPTSFDNYAEVFAKLGYPVSFSFTSIFPKEGADLTPLVPVVGQKGAKEVWVGLAPFAAHAGKIYPEEKMRDLIALLNQRHPSWRFFLFGGGGRERDLLTAWAEPFPKTQCVGTLLHSLDEELILMSRLDAMVSMDSANMHLASVVGTPVVSVWGATHPFAGFMGWGQPAENTIQVEDLPCRPCSVYGNTPCLRGDFACMAGIAPERIVKRIEEVVAK